MRKITLLLFTIFLLGQTACKKDKKEEIIPDPLVPTITKIIPGRNHTFLIKSDHTLYACGLNDDHQIDLNTGLFVGNQDTFVKVMDGILDAAAGVFHSHILKTDNTLWACGQNTYGQLGKGMPPALFRKVADNVVKVSSINNHTLILKKDGSVWATGNNGYGQLGIGTTENSSEFIQIATNAKDIATSYYTSFIIKTDNTLWATGRNNENQLGDGTNVNKLSLVQVNTGVSQVACGVSHTLILKGNTVYGVSNNTNNQLGNIPVIDRNWKELKSNISSVQAGIFSSFLITKKSTFISGKNTLGHFGGIENIESDDVKEDFGDISYFNFNKIYVGAYTTFLIIKDKYILTTGNNNEGQLGIGSYDSHNNLVFVSGFADPDAP